MIIYLMRRLILTLFAVMLICTGSTAQVTLDSIRTLLTDSPVQEKVYLHIDNTCYFIGDTIWYKAYVVRADDLTVTDMSRILYVELVSPDGLVTERQTVVVSDKGLGNGNFALPDSLYSGYYELRAYTRWMMNFAVTEHGYNIDDAEKFYSRQMARDFFRQYGTVYSRVVPVYERPEEEGDYNIKYIVKRPKQRLDEKPKTQLNVGFYPEGGHLIAGTECTVAFDVTNELGRQIDIEGRVGEMAVKTQDMGRGKCTIKVPAEGRLKAHFTYQDRDWTFDLPKIEQRGCALRLTQEQGTASCHLQLVGMPATSQYGAAVLCRGRLCWFQTIQPDAHGKAFFRIEQADLPTGVNDLVVFDNEGHRLADRLFFVNNHDYDEETVRVTGQQDEYEPYEKVSLSFHAPDDASLLSIAVRDNADDEYTYDTGNILTDLLLSGDLKGFVAYPDYYFEADDEHHRTALDLLMMVQGWRRYDFDEMLVLQKPRYLPEKTLTVDGMVYETESIDEYKAEDNDYMARRNESMGDYTFAQRHEDFSGSTREGIASSRTDESPIRNTNIDGSVAMEQTEGGPGFGGTPALARERDMRFGINHGGLNHEVTIESELVFDAAQQMADVKLETTDGGCFSFTMPPFYGDGVLFIRAYDTDLSEKRQKRLKNKGFLDEDEYPEYYIKLNMFFPIFAKKYSFYQCHRPTGRRNYQNDSLYMTDNRRLSTMDADLDEIEVKSHLRKSRHAIDYSKPVYVCDTYELYNLATDYGLSFGRWDFYTFPTNVCTLLLGNYNSGRQMTIEARMNDDVFFRNFDSTVPTTASRRSDFEIERDAKLKRQDKIRFYTDFELRNEDRPIDRTSGSADVTLDFKTIDNMGMRYTYRDRRIIYHGIYMPDDFYHPDYSERPLPEIKDYRRTLYWNPNAPLDEDGTFTATFYNNSRKTKIAVSVAGVSHSGQLLTVPASSASSVNNE